MAKLSKAECRRLARLLGGQVLASDSACVVQRLRTNLDLKVLGRRTRSPLNLPFALSFEDKDSKGRTLNFGETVILPKEINRFVLGLRQRGITVTALHNHWLFQNIGFKYIHWQSIDTPEDFVRKSLGAAKQAGIFN